MRKMNKHEYMMAAVIGLILIMFSLPLAASDIDNLKYPELNQIEIPEPTKVVLDNGMALYLLEDHTLPRVSLSVRMNRCGSYLEPPTLLGLADMTGEVMRTGGTENMTGDEIDEALEAIGASVETGIDLISGSASANSLSDYKEEIVRILADVLRRPVFDEDKVELARTNQRTAISRRNDQPIPIAVREFRKLIYGAASPYARYPEYATIDAITRSDLVMFHKMAVHPNNIQMAIWGDFNTDDMVNLIKKYFEDWPRSSQEIPAPPDVDYKPVSTVNYAEKDDINQAVVLMGHIGGRMGDPDYAATIVMNSILGESFGSRLFRNVRTKQGLAYSTGGTFSFNYDYPGYFISYTLTKMSTVGQAIRAMKEQIASMATIPPSEDEMKLGKDGWLNSFVFNFDTKGEILGRMMTYDYYGMPRDYLQQLKTKVENLKPDDIMAVAGKKLDTDHLQIMVVGNAADFDEPLSNFGDVNDIDITIPTPAIEEFSASAEELAQGMDWLNKAATACGGADKFKAIKTAKTTSNATIKMPQGSMTVGVTDMKDFGGMRSAQIISTPMGEQKMVFLGSEGWAGMGGQFKALDESGVAESVADFNRDLINVMAHIDNPYYKVAYKGDEDFGGQAATRLDFLTNDGNQFTLYLNSETSLPIGLKYMGQTMMGPGKIVDQYTQLADFNGIKYPSAVNQDAGGMTVQIDDIKLETNAALDESVFARPDGI